MILVPRAPTSVAPGRGIVVLSLSLLGPSLTACGPEATKDGTTDAPGTSGVTDTLSTTTEASTATTTGIVQPTTTGMSTTTADTGSAEGCRGDAECAPGHQCVGPTNEVCAECRVILLLCAFDFDCAPGDVCIEVPEPCPCDSPFTTICTLACNTSADCADGAVCDPGSDHCVYDPCGSDEDCPPLFACVPVLGGDACRRRRCDLDADCGEAVCIDERCHAGPGTCTPEVGW